MVRAENKQDFTPLVGRELGVVADYFNLLGAGSPLCVEQIVNRQVVRAEELLQCLQIPHGQKHLFSAPQQLGRALEGYL